jgi:2-polyprenyl-6-methoxyphenol hydroxylase-like FAD-dependent oxidoreductase
MTKTVVETSVLIVGGGPAGLTAALLLAHHGVPTVLAECRLAPSQHPRARGVHARAMEILRGLGIEDDLRSMALPIRSGVEWRSTLGGPVQRELSLPSAVDHDISPCEGLAMAQDVFESVLRGHVQRAEPVLARWGSSLTDFTVVDGGVEATITDQATGLPTTVRARYLLGADGVRSVVRERLGITFHGAADLGRQRGVAFRADLTRWTGSRPRGMYFLTEVGSVMFSTHPDNRWALGVLDPRHGERDAHELVVAAIGEAVQPLEILADSRWTLGAQSASNYSHGRVFLLGDAAHRVTPMGATGVSTAIHDANNLAWKIAAVDAGRATPDLLATYGTEREPVGRATVAASLVAWQTAMSQSPEQSPTATLSQIDMGYRYRSTAVLDDGPGGREELDYSPSARPGCRAPHAWIDVGGRRTSTIDLFTRRFVVLSASKGDDWLTAARAIARDGGDLDAHLFTGLEWARRYGIGPHGAVIVRRDGHVAWRRAGGPDQSPRSAERLLSRVLRQVTGRQTASTTPLAEPPTDEPSRYHPVPVEPIHGGVLG